MRSAAISLAPLPVTTKLASIRRAPAAPAQMSARVRYRKAALRSGYGVAAPAALACFALPLASWALGILAVTLQLVALVLLPRLRWFRAYVDEQEALQERHRLLAARGAVLGRVSDDQRGHLERLEAIVDRIIERVERSGPAREPGDCYGLRAVLATYATLAVAEHTARQQLARTNRQALTDEIEAMSSERQRSARVQVLCAKRQAIAEQRRERWDRTATELERIRHQLAALAAMVHLVDESTLAAVDIDAATADVEQVMADFASQRGVLDELATLSVVEDTIDPRIFVVR